MSKYRKSGISLIVLVITIIVILILAGIIIFAISNGGVLDNAKKAKFMSDFRSVEEGVNVYSISNIQSSNPTDYKLPLEGKLTLSDKNEIVNKVPTLNTKIIELNPGKTINDIDLYWINEPVIGANNIPSEKKDKGYIIDIATKQIYDYYGDYFLNLRWHTLDSGVAEVKAEPEEEIAEELWDGWIKLTLYYPSSSTARQWRLGKAGEIRTGTMLMWQDYTGPIAVPLDRVKDVWIKYKLNGQDVIIPPAGTLLVDIQPDKTDVLTDKVNITIAYDESATIKEYRVGRSGWITYTGPFTVTENCIVEARANKIENVYNTDGSLLTTRNIAGSDRVFIDNIGIKNIDTSLPAPTIARLDPQSADEKAKVQVTYPAGAVKKVYTINYGEEKDYTDTISVKTYGTYVIAYYYDASGKRSNASAILINDTSTGESPQPPKPHSPLPSDNPKLPNPGTSSYKLPAPTITRLAAQGADEKARVQVTYPAQANKKIYVQNNGDEQSYTNEISVKEWGTYIIAYYYDTNGNLSQASWITINPDPTPAEDYPPMTVDPKYVVLPPTINIEPNTGIVSEVTVSVSSPANADKTYLKIGRYSEYKEYTSPIVVRDNAEVYAYYTTLDGKTSIEANAKITNIRQSGGNPTKLNPYVYINANPYPWSGSYGVSKVTITVGYSEADKIEYSEDGIVYKPYTGSFDITKNERIYARGTNVNGVTNTYLDITNIGELTPLTPLKRLAVSINVDPEPTFSTTKVSSAKVTIEYDTRATEKYYRIGEAGDLKTYTGPFNVTSNCTVYAYAKSADGKGETSKRIDNLIDGIVEPFIKAIPNNEIQASKVNISIYYDSSATVKRYSINGGEIRDYVSSFDVTENGTTIYAYSENYKGEKSESRYVIQNIVPEPPMLLLDMGDYYLLKLNYPDGSKNKEYKWKMDGEWKTYKEAGIMLIKPQFKDKLLQNGVLVKVKNDNGDLVTFGGDYYLLDVPTSQLSESLFMRWDRVAAAAPQIVLNTTDPAKQVTATIAYDSSLIQKKYRVVGPGETPGQWKDYTGPITVDKNNSVIYAKGMDDTEVWSQEGMYKVTNIDEIQPTINLTADLTLAQQKVAVKVSVTDDIDVGKVKWASGLQGESYFETNGTEIPNGSIVNITSNGYYTFYAEDKVGNKQVYTLNVANVDLTPPSIDIAVNPENTVGLNANVTITYDSSAVTKQYKVGTSNVTWNNYTGTFAISSYTILTNNWQNSDGTVTIYAKGIDSAGNEKIVQKKILNLDLDAPKTPVINSNAAYPLLTAFRVMFEGTITITYDTRTDIDNYYSLDNGTTWNVYTGQLNLVSGTIIAKSVKKDTNLEVSVSKTLGMPSDALKVEAYDGNNSTGVTAAALDAKQYIQVDSSMQGKKIEVSWYSWASDANHPIYLRFLDEYKNQISSVSRLQGSYTDIYIIPSNAKWIMYDREYSTWAGGAISSLYEIRQYNEPTFSSTNGYMLLTADSAKVIRIPYQMVNVSYNPKTVQRLYRIGTTGDWLNYNDQPIKVEQGKTIYAKGIDQYGIETRIVSSYTVNVPDALKTEVYDNNDSTYVTYVTNQYMQVDSNVWGKNIRVKWYSHFTPMYIKFLNENQQEISNVSEYNYDTYFDKNYAIPNGTKWIKYEANGTNDSNRLYEIQLDNAPIFILTNQYMLLSADPAKAIRRPSEVINISYFGTSLQRLYRIGTTGEWLNYNDQPIKLDQGQTIYAKGIDKYGTETRLITSHTGNVSDALKAEAYDGDVSTAITAAVPDAKQYMQVDSNMQGKQIEVSWYSYTGDYNWPIYLKFLDENKNVINTVSRVYGFFKDTYTIPANTKWIMYDRTLSSWSGGAVSSLYEMKICDEPTFSSTTQYMVLSSDVTKVVKTPYQNVNVSYSIGSVQKLYRIGTTGDWLNYNNQPIKLIQGQTIYAKGIDIYGNETRLVSSYTCNLSDALKTEAYDNNDATYVYGVTNQYMEVDNNMWGKNIRVKWYTENKYSYIRFLDSNKNEISNITRYLTYQMNETYTVPSGTKWIKYEGYVHTSVYTALYEIYVVN